jgi:hypothetical protein
MLRAHSVGVTNESKVAAPTKAVMPAKAGIQYVASFRFHYFRLGILDDDEHGGHFKRVSILAK